MPPEGQWWPSPTWRRPSASSTCCPRRPSRSFWVRPCWGWFQHCVVHMAAMLVSLALWGGDGEGRQMAAASCPQARGASLKPLSLWEASFGGPAHDVSGAEEALEGGQPGAGLSPAGPGPSLGGRSGRAPPRGTGLGTVGRAEPGLSEAGGGEEACPHLGTHSARKDPARGAGMIRPLSSISTPPSSQALMAPPQALLRGPRR